MNVKFDVNLKWQDVFRFNLYQTYTGMQGILGIALPILIFVLAGMAYSKNAFFSGTLYILGGLLVLLYLPFTLFIRAKTTMKKNEVLANTLHFDVNETAIQVSQGEENGELPWDQVYKLVSVNRLILIYSSRINAYIIPEEALGDQYEDFRKLAAGKLPAYRMKLKQRGRL